MDEKKASAYYCNHCLVDGEFVHATELYFNFADRKIIPLCRKHLEEEISYELRIEMNMN